MGKRRGEDAGINMHMRREEYEVAEEREEDDDGDGNGTSGSRGGGEMSAMGFQRADEETLKKRNIKKAKRRLKPGQKAPPLEGGLNPFASVKLIDSAPATTTNATNTGESFSFTSSNSVSGLQSNSSASQKETSTIASPSVIDSSRSDYLENVSALNQSFLDWISNQDITESWEKGVQDYVLYAAKIVDSRSKTNDASQSEGKKSVSFAFEPKSNLSSFLSSSSSLFPPSTGSIFAQGAENPFTPDNALVAQGKEEESSKEEEPQDKVVSDAGENERLLHRVRAHVKCLPSKEDGWKTKGTGDLLLLSHRLEQSKSWLLMRTESTGRVVFNAPLYKSMSVKLDEKKNAVSFVGVSYEEKGNQLVAEHEGKPALYFIKVKTLESAKELMQKIKENIPI